MEHPITPPDELMDQWADMLASRYDHVVFSIAAQWGADQELEACCEWVSNELSPDIVDMLRAARRPKAPTLKEQALEALDEMNAPLGCVTASRCDTIRRALEQLND